MKNCRVVHRLRRRIRVIAPALVKEQERCYILEILLRKHAAVQDVRIVPDIGSVVISYDPVTLPETRLLAILDAVLGNLECNAAVEGMTCASCALLIEMSLQRDPRVDSAAVNFASGTVTVRGHLPREELFASVKKLGYEVRPMDTLAQRRLIVEREKAAAGRCEEAPDPGRLADRAGDGLGHADAPLARAARCWSSACPAPWCSAAAARSSGRPGCWRSSAKPTWTR
jgi:copper chaperone CopZ